MTDKRSYRLTKIYTRQGDKGSTSLADGTSISKTDPSIEALGAVDEINSWIGLILCEYKAVEKQQDLFEFLQQIQQQLFNLGAEIATEQNLFLDQKQILSLETWIDQLNENLPPLTNFILPGGSKLTCYCHLARTVARRAERELIRAKETRSVGKSAISYVNRLSDFLFVLARFSAEGQQKEILWQQPSKQKN